jgi:hypothetical protein
MASAWEIIERSDEVVARVTIACTCWMADDDEGNPRYLVTADVKGASALPKANPNGTAISKRSAYANWREKLRMAKGR